MKRTGPFSLLSVLAFSAFAAFATSARHLVEGKRSALVWPFSIFAFVVTFASTVVFAAPLFPNPIFDAGDRPISVAGGDFDGNGHPDLVVVNQLSDDVSVLLGNGDGTFVLETRFGVGGFPTGVAIGDFNGDGRQDLAVANQRTGDVSVLLGNGDGTFAPEMHFESGSGAFSVAVGDFDADGRQDLAVANGGLNSNTVSVLLGNGDGSFAPGNPSPSRSGTLMVTGVRISWR
jgi:hypothetical protein